MVLLLDVLFVPVALAGSFPQLTMQVLRLRERDSEFTRKTVCLVGNFENSKPDAAADRLQSGLQLLDTVLSPSEAIVFRRDSDGHLVSSARLRATQSDSLDTGRNSAWREGVRLCERAIARERNHR